MGLISRSMSRRGFLKVGITASLLGLFGEFIPLKPVRVQSTPSLDSIVLATNGTPAELVYGALEALGGINRFVSPGDKVLIKPNASFAYGPLKATNTNPEIASTVASLCFQAGASEVVFADNVLMKPASNTVEVNGLRVAAEGCGAEFKILGNRSDFMSVEIEGSSVLKQADIAKLYIDSDVFINIPVLKHHESTGTTIGLKNLMGLVYDRGAFHRKGLHECIAELSLFIKPDITLIDATRSLMTNGPQGPGEIVEFGKVVAGVDPLAVEIAGLALGSSMGYRDFNLNGVRNRYIDVAAELGIGDGNPESVALKTVEWDVSENIDSDIIEPLEEDGDSGKTGIPSWVAYASISTVSVTLGLAGIIYARRRAEVARKEKI